MSQVPPGKVGDSHCICRSGVAKPYLVSLQSVGSDLEPGEVLRVPVVMAQDSLLLTSS